MWVALYGQIFDAEFWLLDSEFRLLDSYANEKPLSSISQNWQEAENHIWKEKSEF